MGVITALQVQKRNKERVNVFLDGEYAFSLALIEAATLKKGQTLTEAEIQALHHADDINRAADQAARFLSYRPRSIQEVRQNLAKKDYPEAIIEAAIDRMTGLGYLDDAAFARYWLQNRDTFKPRGAMALRYELKQKGIADDLITQVLAEFDAHDAAYRAAQARVARLRGSSRYVFTQKLGSFLQRRGFHYATCRDVIEQLINDIAADDPAFFMDFEDDASHDLNPD